MEVRPEDVNQLYERLHKEAEASGYHLNPDLAFTKDLLRGLILNERRYGYWACPCRLASGNKEEDIDIICPCYYRDSDLMEHDTCYCALYVSLPALRGEKEIKKIPERRPPLEERRKIRARSKDKPLPSFDFPIWRCRVCGYLCAREQAPETCPICKAKKERFEAFA